MRHDGRTFDELRPVTIKRHFTTSAPGSVLIQAGRTTVLCTACVLEEVPEWLAGQKRGWVTAEYAMLPGSTSKRKPRERSGKVDSRSLEIQRLIGRSLRAVTDLGSLGERTIAIDCDVLEADGGTRTTSITGSFIALIDALKTIVPADSKLPVCDSVAAVSVGLVEGQAMLDLNYAEDAAATVDMNIVMTGHGRFVELQGSGEEATFTDDDLANMLALARNGIAQLTAIQREVLGDSWPFR